jgi:hypothetical protein
LEKWIITRAGAFYTLEGKKFQWKNALLEQLRKDSGLFKSLEQKVLSAIKKEFWLFPDKSNNNEKKS